MKLNTYLNYGGNCADAFRFYEKELGGKIGMMMTHDQAPDQTNVTPELAKAVLYANITIGETVIMASAVCIFAWEWTATPRPSGPTSCSPTGEKSTCPCRRRSLPPALRSCATNLEPLG